MGWLSDENGAMYYVEDTPASNYSPSAGATTNYFDASANGGNGGQVYVYGNGSTVTTDPTTGQPVSSTAPTSQYTQTSSNTFRPTAGSPTSTNVGGYNIGVTDPTYMGSNGQIATNNGVPVTQRIQPTQSGFDQAMQYGTLGLAVAPWLLAAGGAFPATEAGAGESLLGNASLEELGAQNAEAAANEAAQTAAYNTAPEWLTAAEAAGLTASQLANLLKGGSALSSLLGGSQSGTGSAGGNAMSSALKNLALGSAPQGQATTPWTHGNVNPFVKTQDLPIQTPQKTELSSIADLLRQG